MIPARRQRPHTGCGLGIAERADGEEACEGRMLQKIASAFVVFGLVMSLSACGRKNLKNPRRPARPPTGTATGLEREFNGEWISKCIADGSQWFMDYYWIENGGLINQQMWFSDDNCSADKMTSFEQYEGKFRVVGNS